MAFAPALASSRAAFSRPSRSASACLRAAVAPPPPIWPSRRASAPSRSPCTSSRRRMSSRAASTAPTSPPWRRFRSSQAFIRACSCSACSGSNTRFWLEAGKLRPKVGQFHRDRGQPVGQRLARRIERFELPRLAHQLRHAAQHAVLAADAGRQRLRKLDELLRLAQPLEIPFQRLDRLRRSAPAGPSSPAGPRETGSGRATAASRARASPAPPARARQARYVS